LDKNAISKIGKQYLRSENVNFACAPKCNKEIWNAIGNNTHSKDLSLQEVHKFLTLGLTSIINMTDNIAKTKEHIYSDTGGTMLTDAISLIGHSFLLLSNKRRQSLRNYIHDRYNKICSTDVPITNQLFGDSCLNKLKEMGDINKYPGKKIKVPSNPFSSGNVPYSVGASFNSGGFRPGNLNFRGQFPRGGRGQPSRRPRLMIPPQYPPRSRDVNTR
jgi:hypothetical protein